MTRFVSTRTVLCLSLSFLIAACSGTRLLDDRLAERYRAAIRDAERAEPEEVSRSLRPVLETDPALRWRRTDEGSEVLVVTWIDAVPDVARGATVTTAIDTWVTLVPEARSACRAFGLQGADLALRLDQMLGLPPRSGMTHFVEYWVDPDDLFRPCPDPEITDHECSIVAPRPRRVLAVDETYQAWFDALRASTYGPSGYPWTRLGYTYDWGSAESEIGLSEYVIWPGAQITFAGAYSAEAYCR